MNCSCRTQGIGIKAVKAFFFAAAAILMNCASPMPARAQHPSWINSAVIYCVNPEIFSTTGFAGVTGQLSRLQSLGVNVIWIQPCYPRGVTGPAGHTPFNSPYCIKDYTTVNPNFGTEADLTTLVSTAHSKGMKVILDAVINHTSYDNALCTQHPEWYLHTDGNLTNVNSIQCVNYGTSSPMTDIAQLNYTNTSLQAYITSMLQSWITRFGIDGFRFDMADNPFGSTRLVPQSYWNSVRTALEGTKSDILMLGEEEDSQLATSPFELDYGWNMLYYGIRSAFTTANNASTLSYQWTYPYTSGFTSPAGMMRMNIQDDWDLDRDIVTLGGYPQAMAAAVFNFTIDGVPLVYNGMEAANNSGGVNPHIQVNWTGTNSAQFNTFYTQMIALRNGSGGALQQGTLTWLTNSSAQVVTYDRTGGGNEYIVEINTNGTAASGTITGPTGTWTEVTPAGAPGGQTHVAPPSFNLAAYDFAIFKKGTASAPGAPSSLSPTAGNTQVALTWSAGSGATSYNLYRSTTAGGEGTTPVVTGISGTSYTNTGLTNGAAYYFKVAAVNSVGTSGMSNEATATPAAGGSGGSLTGAVTAVSTAQAFNLTTQGTTDWAAWGNGAGFDHSASGGTQISNASVAGGGAMTAFNSSFLGLTWTNGTPDASATNETNGYFNNGGVNDGFQFTVPAGTSSQKVIVYVGGWNTGGTLTATLSDGSAATYTNSSQSSTGSYYAYYTLTYNAGSAGKTLTVKWTEASGTGNVTLYAAALQPGTVSTPAAPTGLGAAAGNTQAVISWTASSGATSYNVYRGTTAGGESTTAIATGVSTASYTNTGLTNGTTYYYKVAAVNTAGTSGMSNEASCVPTVPPAGSLSGTVTAVSTAQAFNLTTQGTTDWAAWGYGAGNFEHSSAGGSKISNASVFGGGAMTSFASSFLGSTWTNGTPDASVTNETNGFYNNGGVGDGFQFTAPAGTAVQHLTVYVGGWNTGGTLTATLSDGSAATYTNTSQSSTGSYYAHYDLTFNAGSAGKTLTVVWKQASGTGNVTLYSATLH